MPRLADGFVNELKDRVDLSTSSVDMFNSRKWCQLGRVESF